MAASPLVVDDKVIVLPGGTSGKSVVAYNKMTGAPVWKSQNDTAAYVSPMLVNLQAAGKSLWSALRALWALFLKMDHCCGVILGYGHGHQRLAAIMVDKNRFFISAGYGKGAALVEVTGSGKNFPRAQFGKTST